MALAPLPDDWMDKDKTDEEIGKTLLRWFMGLLAEKFNLPVDQIPQDFQERAIQRIIPNAEAQTAESAALALALRKAVSGDLQSAGRIIREYMNAGARYINTTKLAQHGNKFKPGRHEGSITDETSYIHQLVKENRNLSAKSLFAISDKSIVGDMSLGTFSNHVSVARKQYPKEMKAAK